MNYIERNPAKCFSMPSLIGRRLTVFDVVTQINGDGLIDVLKDYELSIHQAKEVLEYCSSLSCKIDSDKFQFCDGCVLRVIKDKYEFNKDDYFEVTHLDGIKATISKDDNSVFLGSVSELEREERGQETWQIAEFLLKKYFDGEGGGSVT